MLARRAYYKLKPLIPRWMRVAMRQARARRILKSCESYWPILESAGSTPAGWPGWPEQKQFGFFLSHDVEGQSGCDRVPALMEVERQLGFRSSFNFVPEGSYRVPTFLREQLLASGFEVGVHDLHHDGKLYDSHSGFTEKARRINQYLREWRAVGFRSAFMLHNLEWLRDLEVRYDASTFDTDPFEPQPDGVGTIFPFYVPGFGGSNGYVELPYTLVQDFTLFVVLGEKTIDIWKRKLDWIAAKGGMALLNLHPDYVHFGRGPCPADEFPVSLYEQFLNYAKTEYHGRYWHDLPRAVAEWCPTPAGQPQLQSA